MIINIFGISRSLGPHIADIDAHNYTSMLQTPTGQYYAHPYSPTSTETAALAINTLFAIPLILERAMTFDRIAIEVSTAEAAKAAYLGIYANGTNMYPGALVLDAGTVSLATTGIKTVTISQALTRGVYFLVLLQNGTTAKVYSGAGLSRPLGMQATSFAGTYNRMWTVAQAYGALPATFTAGGALVNDFPPFIGLRVLSLD